MLAWLLLAACGRPPDLVLITLDTTRRDAIGAYGGPPTPVIDRLAAEGIRYDRASTVVPLTIPAHAALLTGRWPTSTGVRDNGDQRLAATEVTLAETLAAAGYDTGAAVGAQLVGPAWGFDQGFASFDAPATPERRADAVIDAALAFLARDHHDAPVFLWVHLYDPHAPYAPPIPTDDPYLGEVAYVDQQLGRLMEALRARDAWARTGVVIVADHGEGRGDHGETEHGALTFSSTTGVPLIVRPPGGAPPRVVANPISTVDIVPTLLGWASLALPPGIDGQTLDGPTRPVFVESHYLARHLGWAPIDVQVDTDGSWVQTTRSRRYDPADHALPDPAGPLPTALAAHLALAPPEAVQPSGDLAALAALGYLDGVTQRRVPVDPIDAIAGYEALRVASGALAAGDEPSTKAALAVALAADPTSPAIRLLAIALRARTDPAGALPEARALVAEAPSARGSATLGTILAKLGQLREAAPYLADAARELPPDPRQMGLLGLALAETGDDAASDWLLRALSAEPDQPLLRGALGRLALRARKPADAIQWLTEEIDRYPPAIDARKALVEALIAARRWDDALAALDLLDALRPPESGAAYARAKALHELGDEKGAQKALSGCLAAANVPPVCDQARRGRW